MNNNYNKFVERLPIIALICALYNFSFPVLALILGLIYRVLPESAFDGLRGRGIGSYISGAGMLFGFTVPFALFAGFVLGIVALSHGRGQISGAKIAMSIFPIVLPFALILIIVIGSV
jgi:hypothetical protein